MIVIPTVIMHVDGIGTTTNVSIFPVLRLLIPNLIVITTAIPDVHGMELIVYQNVKIIIMKEIVSNIIIANGMELIV
jgi:hypothetical protein